MSENESFTIDANFVKSNNLFAFKLFYEVFSSNKDKNIFISPLSLAINLAMLHNGTDGTTAQEIRNLLELDNFQASEINTRYLELLEFLCYSEEKIQLLIANSLWGSDQVDFNQEFIEKSKKYFKGEVKSVDFLNPKTKNLINSWTSAKTNNKIKEIVDQINPDTVLITLNAIYFKAQWTKKFDPTKTELENFYITKKKSLACSMMFSDDRQRSFFTEEVSATFLDYGNKDLSLYLFLPSEDSNLEEFCQSLSLEKYDSYISQPWNEEAIIAIPKFTFDFKIDLSKYLSQLGFKEIFYLKANFTPMINTKKEMFLNEIVQKTFLEVNEEGTTAAAVTASSLVLGIPSTLQFNRPFFYLIRDNKTGLILFMGTLVDPNCREFTEEEKQEMEKDKELKKKLTPFHYLITKELKRQKKENPVVKDPSTTNTTSFSSISDSSAFIYFNKSVWIILLSIVITAILCWYFLIKH